MRNSSEVPSDRKKKKIINDRYIKKRKEKEREEDDFLELRTLKWIACG